jgi:DNA invertase Pin-like site-specific DNA recombinase
MKVARIYLRVSTDEQDLTRQAEIEQSARSAGYYIAGVYREKASGARAAERVNDFDTAGFGI